MLLFHFLIIKELLLINIIQLNNNLPIKKLIFVKLLPKIKKLN